jgi:hypothetical protein
LFPQKAIPWGGGDKWYETVTHCLQVSSKTTPRDLADALAYELCPKELDGKKQAETPDQFRVDVAGLNDTLIHKQEGGFALLLLEDLDVDEISVALTKEEESLDYRAKQKAVFHKLGKAAEFVYYLAQKIHQRAIVVVTTKNKNIAFALHHAVNAGKCGIAKSLLADKSLRKDYPMNIEEKDYKGFGWDAESKIDLLEHLFPSVEKEIIKDKVTEDTLPPLGVESRTPLAVMAVIEHVFATLRCTQKGVARSMIMSC